MDLGRGCSDGGREAAHPGAWRVFAKVVSCVLTGPELSWMLESACMSWFEAPGLPQPPMVGLLGVSQRLGAGR